jgi:hypothetical protein
MATEAVAPLVLDLRYSRGFYDVQPKELGHCAGARRLDAGERQVGPFGELVAKHPANERLVDLKLVDVHPRHQPTLSIGEAAQRDQPASVIAPGQLRCGGSTSKHDRLLSRIW